MKKLSLTDRIEAADSVESIQALLAEGREYKWASPVTRRKWNRSAIRRTKEVAR